MSKAHSSLLLYILVFDLGIICIYILTNFVTQITDHKDEVVDASLEQTIYDKTNNRLARNRDQRFGLCEGMWTQICPYSRYWYDCFHMRRKR